MPLPEHVRDTTGYANILPIKCPRCKVAAGVACMYTSGPPEKIGLPCKMTHWERDNAIIARKREAARKAELARITAPFESNRLAIIEAERRAEVHEHEELKEWLREHGLLLMTLRGRRVS